MSDLETTSTYKAAAALTGSEGFATGLDLGLGVASIGLGSSAARGASKTSWSFFSKESATVKEVEGTGLKAHSMSDKEARIWYHEQMASIPSRIDSSLPKEKQALQAFKLRNEIKMQTRELMSSRIKAKVLDYKDPPKSLKDIAKKSYDRNVVGDDFWSSMRDSSMRSNKKVDARFNLNSEHQPRFK